MIIRKRILKSLLLGLFLMGVFSTWYINRFLGPTTLKNFFLKNISQVIDRPVSLNAVHFNIIRGFTLDGLTIYEPDGKTVFIKADRISTTLLFIPILKEKYIMIPSIHIDSLTLNVVKDEGPSWNFSSPPLLKKLQTKTEQKQKGFSFLVSRISLTNSRINFLDNTKTPPYSKQLINLDGETTFSAKKGALNFRTISQLNIPQKTGIGIEGSYFLKDETLVIKAVAKDLPLSEPYNYFYNSSLVLNLAGGMADVSIDLKAAKAKQYSLVLNSQIKNLDASSSNLNLNGDIEINGTLDMPPDAAQPNFKIDLYLAGPTLSGVYLLDKVSGLKGKIEISKDGISSPGLEGYAYNTPIKFTGGLKNLKNPQLRLTADASLDLINYKNFLPQGVKERFKDVYLEGPAKVTIKLFNRFKDPAPLSLTGKIGVKNALLKTAALPNKFEIISGEIVLEEDVIYVSRASFWYKEQNYMLDSKITNFDSPDFKIKLKNDELSVDSRFQILKNSIRILRFDGRYLNSSLKLTGDVLHLENPDISMRGNSNLELSDLRKIFPSASEALAKFDIKGMCNLDFSLNGPVKEPAALNINLRGQSDRIGLWNLKLDELRLNLRMQDKRLVVPELSAKPYGGTFVSTIEIDLAQQNPPYSLNLILENVDLSRLAQDTDLKNKDMSGKALCKSNIRGYGKNPETIKGEGYIFIKGGYLWAMPLLKGIADLLFMPNLSNIVFDEASANFVIANKVISTSDMKFHSQNVGLLAEGNLFFDGTVDFLVTTSISENLLKSTSEFERLASALLAEAGKFIGRIKIYGSIKKAEYKFIPFPLDQILKDKLKGFLGGFF